MSWAHGIAARARPVLALVPAAVMGLVGAGGASAAGAGSVGGSGGVGDVMAPADALPAADAGGPSTIVLGAGCSYTLTRLDNGWYGANGLPPISATITIDGNGATITRQGRSFRFFYVGANPMSPGTFGYQ